MDSFIWAVLWLISLIGCFLYGRHFEATKGQGKKYDELTEDDEPKDLKLYKEEPKDPKFLKKELERERETKKKLVDQYETEINYLKGMVSKNQANFDAKLVTFP